MSYQTAYKKNKDLLRGIYSHRINSFKIERVPQENMVYVYLNKTRIYSGNYGAHHGRGDFYNGCSGGYGDNFPNFSDPGSFIKAYKTYIHAVYPEEYRFKDDYELIEMKFETHKI